MPKFQLFDAAYEGRRVGVMRNPIPLPEPDSVVELWAAFSAGEHAPSFDFSGDGYELSFDGGATWQAAGTFPYPIGVCPRVRLLMRRVSGSSARRVDIVHPWPLPPGEGPVLHGQLLAESGFGFVVLHGVYAVDDVGVAKFQYRYERGEETSEWIDVPVTCGPVVTFPRTVVRDLLNDIGHRFEVRAVDSAGNVSDVRHRWAHPSVLYDPVGRGVVYPCSYPLSYERPSNVHAANLNRTDEVVVGSIDSYLHLIQTRQFFPAPVGGYVTGFEYEITHEPEIYPTGGDSGMVQFPGCMVSLRESRGQDLFSTEFVMDLPLNAGVHSVVLPEPWLSEATFTYMQLQFNFWSEHPFEIGFAVSTGAMYGDGEFRVDAGVPEIGAGSGYDLTFKVFKQV